MRTYSIAILLAMGLLACDGSNPVAPVGAGDPAPATAYTLSLSANPANGYIGLKDPSVTITVTVVRNDSSASVGGIDVSVSTSLGALTAGGETGSLVSAPVTGGAATLTLDPGQVPGMVEILARLDDSAGSAIFELKDPGDPPVADFETEANGLEIIFTDRSTGNPMAWEWAFGDASPDETAQNPIHDYTPTGPDTYQVTLTVTNVSDDITKSTEAYKSSLTKFVAVEENPVLPEANFEWDVPTELSVVFRDLSTGEPTSWAWDFGDGSMSTVQNPGHLYSASGTYPVTLEVANGAGRSSLTQEVSVTGTGSGLTAAFSTSRNDLVVIFTDRSGGGPTIWEWNFGDGSATVTSQSPTHTYSMAGTYPVTLTISDGSTSATTSRFVCVNTSPPSASCPATSG